MIGACRGECVPCWKAKEQAAEPVHASQSFWGEVKGREAGRAEEGETTSTVSSFALQCRSPGGTGRCAQVFCGLFQRS